MANGSPLESGPAREGQGRRETLERAGRRAALPLALALVMTALAHVPSLGNGFTNWDDPGHLLENPLTKDPLADGVSGLLTTRALAYPIPVTVLGYAAQRTLFGLSPFEFHLVSLALHLLCVTLAACLGLRLGARRWAAAGAAILFALHPVVVEPVSWVVGQKDLLAGSLLLAALLVRCGARGQRPVAAAVTMLLAVLAIGAKPSAVAAVAILPALDWALRRRADRSAVTLYIGVAVAAAASIAVSLAGHGFLDGEAPASFGPRSLAEALWAVSLHARHLIWPDPLLARYFPPTGAELAAGAILGAALLAALVGAAALVWRRGHREVAFSLVAALLAYAPVAGLVPLSRGPADSYLYLPLALAVIAGARGLGRLAARGRRMTHATAVAVTGIGFALAIASGHQSASWHHARALWQPVARAYPDDPRALMRLGDAELHVGDLEGALVVYEAIQRRFPGYVTSLPAHAAALDALDRPAEAERLLARAVRIDGRPAYLESYGFFLATREVAASDDRAARASLVTVGRLLAGRGKRPETVARAARLLRVYGEVDLAAALERRVAELESRR